MHDQSAPGKAPAMSDDPAQDDSTMTAMDSALRRWSAAHPDATFTEIEQAVDAQLRAVRAGLLANLAGADDPDLPCPDCGARLIRRGTHTRTLWTQGDVPVALTRSYATCPVCGTGLFPPSISSWDCGRAVP